MFPSKRSREGVFGAGNANGKRSGELVLVEGKRRQEWTHSSRDETRSHWLPARGASHRLAGLIIWYGRPAQSRDYHRLPTSLLPLPPPLSSLPLSPLPPSSILLLSTFLPEVVAASLLTYTVTRTFFSTRSLRQPHVTLILRVPSTLDLRNRSRISTDRSFSIPLSSFMESLYTYTVIPIKNIKVSNAIDH